VSPFEEAAAELRAEISALPHRDRCLLFLSASRALSNGHDRWADAAGRPDRIVERSALTAEAEKFILRGEVPEPGLLLDRIALNVPGEPTDVPEFTSGQDCWICLDTSVRGMVGGYSPADAGWYLVEPIFQAVSQRLYGLTDVGSALQGTAEARILQDPLVVAALDAVRNAVGQLSDEGDLQELARVLPLVLAPISPEP
jgi:hypothetical protein